MKRILLLLLVGLTGTPKILAQPPPNRLASLADVWADLRYDPQERGPLLVVQPLLRKPPRSVSLSGYTEAFEGRVFTAGNLTILAPRERAVFNTKLGKPNLFANMPGPERLKLFLGTCSQAQWKALGSTGLGLSGVTDEQKALFQSLLPVEPRLMEYTLVRGEQPGSFQYEDTKYTPVAAESLKLFIGIRNQYFFYAPGGKDPAAISGFYGEGLPQKPGQKRRELSATFERRDSGDAFGQKLFLREPNQFKPSALRYEALGQPVLLEDCATVAEALARAAQATGLELHADKRVAALPLYLRVAPGQSVTAGSLLQGLALGVCGAFRQLEPGAFLLTDDIEGIGSRWQQIINWAQEADSERGELLQKATEQKRTYDPTELVGYRSDDPAALSADLTKKLREAWRKGDLELTLPLTALPPGTQQDVQERMQERENLTLDESHIEVRGIAKIGWVLPSGEYLEEQLGLTNGLGDGLLSDFAPKPQKPTAAPTKAAKPPTGFPATLSRRLLALQLTTPAEAQQAVREAKRLKITELWVTILPSATESAEWEPLRAALAQGKASGISVGALVPLLRDRRLGKPERTVTLQSGEAFADAMLQRGYVKRHPENQDWYGLRANNYRNWQALSGQDDAALRVFFAKLAALPGLAGIALKHTGAPGFTGAKSGGDGLDSGGELGYTPERRLAFVRKEGYDPIDLGGYSYALQKTPSLPFFPSPLPHNDPTHKLWYAFRDAEAKARLKRLFGVIQTTKPGLPLFISDRVSDYADPNTAWYGSWDAAEKLPNNDPVYATGTDARRNARSASKSSFLLYRKSTLGTPETFATTLQRLGKEALEGKWSGLWLDMTALSAPDALRLLGTLSK